MPKIGIVLSGCASKGGYEVGCMQAIIEHFGMEQIKCVSAASMGALIANSFAIGNEEEFHKAYADMDSGKYGRYILGFPAKKEAQDVLNNLLAGENPFAYELYVSVWNLTCSRVDYIAFHELSQEERTLYMRGALSVPIFGSGTVIDGNRFFDGAFLDNIPVYPLVDKDLDYIFCVYFDNNKYEFESYEFDRKVIKLYDFPNDKRMELLLYKPGSYEDMREYGYEYAKSVIRKLFADPDPQAVYKAIDEYEQYSESTYSRRLTADVVLNNINVMTKRFFKNRSNRKKANQ